MRHLRSRLSLQVVISNNRQASQRRLLVAEEEEFGTTRANGERHLRSLYHGIIVVGVTDREAVGNGKIIILDNALHHVIDMWKIEGIFHVAERANNQTFYAVESAVDFQCVKQPPAPRRSGRACRCAMP